MGTPLSRWGCNGEPHTTQKLARDRHKKDHAWLAEDDTEESEDARGYTFMTALTKLIFRSRLFYRAPSPVQKLTGAEERFTALLRDAAADDGDLCAVRCCLGISSLIP